MDELRPHLPLLGLGVAVALALGGLVTYWEWDDAHPRVVIVNLTGRQGLRVEVDRRDVVEAVPVATSEAELRDGDELITTRLTVGLHRFKAYDADGALLDEVVHEVEPGTVIVYAPARRGDLCLWQETTYYGDSPLRYVAAGPRPVVEPIESLVSVDDWFDASPGSVSTTTNLGWDVRTALRLRECL